MFSPCLFICWPKIVPNILYSVFCTLYLVLYSLVSFEEMRKGILYFGFSNILRVKECELKVVPDKNLESRIWYLEFLESRICDQECRMPNAECRM